MTLPYDPELDRGIQEAKERLLRAEHLSARDRQLGGEIASVERRVGELQVELATEEKDVTWLEGRSFTALISGLQGNKDEKLSRERAEADAARLRLAGQSSRLDQLRRDLGSTRRDLAGLEDAGAAYSAALSAKEDALRSTGGPVAEELGQIAGEMAELVERIREHDEAIRAGSQAGNAIKPVMSSLSGATGASTQHCE